MQSLLCLQKVCKSYIQKTTTTEVLVDVSVQFEQGRSYALMGPSGSGKSTCLHILAGIDAPSSGALLLNGQSVANFSPAQATIFLQKHISLVFQQAALFAELTVLENVMLKAILAGTLDSMSYARAYELLQQVGLQDKAHAYPAMLSGGQQQRVAILRAIFVIPDFLLVDEPTGNLDDKTGQALIDLIISYQLDYGMGLIMSTHNQQFAYQMDYVFKVEDKQVKVVKG